MAATFLFNIWAAFPIIVQQPHNISGSGLTAAVFLRVIFGLPFGVLAAVYYLKDNSGEDSMGRRVHP